jgi:hypothetical protein
MERVENPARDESTMERSENPARELVLCRGCFSSSKYVVILCCVGWLWAGTGIVSAHWASEEYRTACIEHDEGCGVPALAGVFMCFGVLSLLQGFLIFPFRYGRLVKAFQKDAISAEGRVISVDERQESASVLFIYGIVYRHESIFYRLEHRQTDSRDEPSGAKWQIAETVQLRILPSRPFCAYLDDDNLYRRIRESYCVYGSLFACFGVAALIYYPEFFSGATWLASVVPFIFGTLCFSQASWFEQEDEFHNQGALFVPPRTVVSNDVTR